MKKSKLVSISILSIFALLLLFGAVIFGFAGTLHFVSGWIYLTVFFAATSVITLLCLIKDPSLVENRVLPQETRLVQKIGQSMAGLLFIGGILGGSGVDFRRQWSCVPLWLIALSDILVALGFLFVYYAFRENTFASKAVHVMDGQRVISSGPYRLVRHPMYLGAVVIILFTPLALDSFCALVPAALLCVYVAVRLLDEEKLLKEELEGYVEYCRKVNYRLIPYIW